MAVDLSVVTGKCPPVALAGDGFNINDMVVADHLKSPGGEGIGHEVPHTADF